MKKALAKRAIPLIPILARRRRRAQAERGAKLGGPALLALAGAAAAFIYRRRKRSDAGFDASPSELSGRQPGTTTGDENAPPNGQGRPSTLDGDPAETVPHAGVEGAGRNTAIPDTSTDDPIVREQEQAAAAEAGSIGGDVPATPPFESFSEREG